MVVALRPIDESNVKAVFSLTVGPGQENFVAPNPWSLAQALAEYEIALPRAIAADDTIVGFLMLQIDHSDEDGRPFWLWRFMIGAEHQRHGYGVAALRLAVDELRQRGATEVFTSWVPGEGSPEGFYLKFGFQPTGEIDGDEIVGRLALAP